MIDKYAQLRQAYHEKMYAKTNVLDGQFEGACTMYRRLYGRFMPHNGHATIVDIGCGAGQFLKFALDAGCTDVIGVDLSDGQVKYARNYVTPHVRLEDGLTFLSQHKAAFDMVVANDFIEHLTKERGMDFVGLAKAAIRPGGRIILKTGNMAAFGGLAIWCNGLDHECGYTEKSLRALLEIWDFRHVEVLPYYGCEGLKKIPQLVFHIGLRLLYKYMYAGDYPKVYTKLIAVTGIA